MTIERDDVFGEVISRYTRAQAIADGVLVDLTDTDEYRECGFKFPVACTAEVYADVIQMNPKAERACNDIKGRLWDVLYMLRDAIRRCRDGSEILYTLWCVTPQSKGIQPSTVRLKSLCGPGDDAEPVITIMFPGQD